MADSDLASQKILKLMYECQALLTTPLLSGEVQEMLSLT